ncbi:MAG: type II toxin-antitoxin system ParD family antitoxin [Methylococcales bacterium]|nr:type II toxin-antitoxin system ParD family antitoxin [Methylococcales bacterium]
MQRKTITLTDQMEDWVKAQVESGKYGNDSEYFRDLVRRDQERQEAETRLRSMLDDAEASGLSDLSPKDIWDHAEALVSKQNG